MLKWIARVILGGADITALVSVVVAGELVAVDDAEDTAVDVEVHAKSEIGPVIVTGAVGLQKFGTLQEDALRNSRVLHAGLDDVESVIVEVEVDDALSDAEVLGGVLNDGLKEVGLEVEDLMGDSKETKSK